MKYYQKLAMMPSFTFADATNVIGKEELVSKNLNSMIHNGSLHRIKQNLYTCVNFSTGADIANRFQIASKVTSDSFISYHTAFEFYGFYNQMYFDVQVCSSKRFLAFSYNDYRYKGYLTKSLEQVEVIQDVRVATIERTIVDSINMIGKVMDAEELVKCLNLVHYVDENKILAMLAIYDRELLYRKVGYVLSFYKEEFSLSDHFFQTCKEKGIFSNKGCFVNNEKLTLYYIKEWGLYGYLNLKDLAYKGGKVDA